jgi:hypothetical protein
VLVADTFFLLENFHITVFALAVLPAAHVGKRSQDSSLDKQVSERPLKALGRGLTWIK